MRLLALFGHFSHLDGALVGFRPKNYKGNSTVDIKCNFWTQNILNSRSFTGIVWHKPIPFLSEGYMGSSIYLHTNNDATASGWLA